MRDGGKRGLVRGRYDAGRWRDFSRSERDQRGGWETTRGNERRRIRGQKMTWFVTKRLTNKGKGMEMAQDRNEVI